MLAELRRLLDGKLSFTLAFGWYVIVAGAIVNAGFSLVALVGYIVTGSAVVMAVLHLLPLPYNAAVCIGAWRSAGRIGGDPWRAQAARTAVLAAFLLLIFV